LAACENPLCAVNKKLALRAYKYLIFRFILVVFEFIFFDVCHELH
jgi:hypothetical protein